jgi:hypothetical protein
VQDVFLVLFFFGGVQCHVFSAAVELVRCDQETGRKGKTTRKPKTRKKENGREETKCTGLGPQKRFAARDLFYYLAMS